ncbi:reverse transcriptase-like protein [Myxococcota bacterium]|nr:reverse transcriptase-like protein [Myxococcota bacterium]
MAWRRATFKDKDVWVEVDDRGDPRVQGGRVGIRYSDKEGAKLYRGGTAGLGMISGPNLELPAGVSADDAPKAGPRGGARGSGFGSAGTRTQAQAHAAAESARDLLAGMPADAAVCFTDGACKGNPGPAGAGCVVRLPDGARHEAWRALGLATNNVGELTAIGMALDLLDELGFQGPVHVLTDSQYSKGVLAQGWKAKANQELVAQVKARVARRKAKLHWIAGHVGIPENERADALANQGVEASRARR